MQTVFTQNLAPWLSDRSVALYVNTPNNPTGRVLAPEVQEALADFARRHDLWLWSDEVYEDYAWERPHSSVAEQVASVIHLELFRENGLECAIEIIQPPDPFTLSILDVL